SIEETGRRERGEVRSGEPQPSAAPTRTSPLPPFPSSGLDDLRHVAAAYALVRAYRNFGHLAAHLDPLGSEPPGDPALDIGRLGLTPDIMARLPAEVLRIYVPGKTLAEALPHLPATYCGTIAYEVEHVASDEQRVRLLPVIGSGEHR